MTARALIPAGTAAVAAMAARLALEELSRAHLPRFAYRWQLVEVASPALFAAAIAGALWLVRRAMSDRNWSVAVVALFAWAFIGWYVTAIERSLDDLVRQRQHAWSHVLILRPDDPSVLVLQVQTVLLLGLGGAAALGALLGQRLIAVRSRVDPAAA